VLNTQDNAVWQSPRRVLSFDSLHCVSMWTRLKYKYLLGIYDVWAYMIVLVAEGLYGERIVCRWTGVLATAKSALWAVLQAELFWWFDRDTRQSWTVCEAWRRRRHGESGTLQLRYNFLRVLCSPLVVYTVIIIIDRRGFTSFHQFQRNDDKGFSVLCIWGWQPTWFRHFLQT